MKQPMRLVLTGLLLTACGGTSATTARTPEMSKFDADSAKAKEQQKLEADDPILKEIVAASKAGTPLEPDAVLTRLETSCKSGNRHSCIDLEINRVQRGGEKTALLAYAKAHWSANMYVHDMQFIMCLGGSADSLSAAWVACQSLKAHFLSEHASKAVSGPSFAKLFPSDTPPSDFPMDGLNLLFKAAPGAMWSCFEYQREAVARGSYFKHPEGSLCSRTMKECLAQRPLLASAAPSTVRITTSMCNYVGVISVFFYQDGPGKMGYVATTTELCKDVRDELDSRKNPSLCVEVGDVIAPGL